MRICGTWPAPFPRSCALWARAAWLIALLHDAPWCALMRVCGFRVVSLFLVLELQYKCICETVAPLLARVACATGGYIQNAVAPLLCIRTYVWLPVAAPWQVQRAHRRSLHLSKLSVCSSLQRVLRGQPHLFWYVTLSFASLCLGPGECCWCWAWCWVLGGIFIILLLASCCLPTGRRESA